MDSLATTTGTREAIVVGVASGAERVHDYTPTVDATIGDGGGADLYLRFLLEELRPWVGSRYRTSGERVGVAGSSLGGLFALHACWARAADLDVCGVFSPSLWWDDRDS